MPTAKAKLKPASPINVSAFIRAQPITMPVAQVLKKLKDEHNIVKKPDLVWSVRKEMRKKGPARSQASTPSGAAAGGGSSDVAQMVRRLVFQFGYEAVTRELDKLKRDLSL